MPARGFDVRLPRGARGAQKPPAPGVDDPRLGPRALRFYRRARLCRLNTAPPTAMPKPMISEAPSGSPSAGAALHETEPPAAACAWQEPPSQPELAEAYPVT